MGLFTRSRRSSSAPAKPWTSEFKGKLVAQILIVVNAIFAKLGWPAIDVSPEVSVIIAGALEALYLSWRQWNKQVQAKGAVRVKEAQADTRARVAEAKAAPTKRRPKR